MAIIYTYPVKTTPANDDLILISDSADGNKTKQIKVSSMPGTQGSGITSLNNATGADQTLAVGAGTPLLISTNTNTNTHTFTMNGKVPIEHGGTNKNTLGEKGQVLSVDEAGTGLSYEDASVKTLVLNSTSSTITAGTPVYISGVGAAAGKTAVPEVETADASNSAKLPVSGLIISDIAPNSEGLMMTSGNIEEIQTNNIPGFTNVGDKIYVADSAGSGAIPFITATKPTGVNLIQEIGQVSKSGGAGVGSIKVSISKVNGLPNFGAKGSLWVGADNGAVRNLTLGTNNHVLTADSSVAGGVKWAAAAASGVTTINFSTTGLTPNSATAGAITVGGVLIGANGGTGYNTYSPGQILYGASGLSPAGTLVKLDIGAAGKVLTVNSAGTAPEWADNAVQASGVSGRVQISDGSGNFTNNAGLSFLTQSLTVGDPASGRGRVVIKGNQSGSPSQLILHSSYNSASPPVSQGSYTIQPPGTTLGPTAFTWTLPNGSPSATGSILTTSSTGTSATLAWAPKVPVANGGTNQTTIGAYAVVVGSGATTTELSSAATGAIQMPVGTTAERPTGALGMIRYNTDTGKMEAFVAGSPNAWTALH